MMTKKFRLALAVLAMAATGAANAAVINLGSVTAPQTVKFGNGWWVAPSEFADEFRFNLTNDADVSGMILEGDWWFGKTDVRLLELTSNSYFSFDTTPGSFSFSGLTNGSYSLYVEGNAKGLFTGYSGTMSFRPTVNVPEPGTLALFGAALVALAFTMKRRQIRG